LSAQATVELLDQYVGPEELHSMAGVDRGASQPDGQVRLPSARRPDQDDVALERDPFHAGQVLEGGPIERGGGTQVEARQVLDDRKAGLPMARQAVRLISGLALLLD